MYAMYMMYIYTYLHEDGGALEEEDIPHAEQDFAGQAIGEDAHEPLGDDNIPGEETLLYGTRMVTIVHGS
jgi:hypothetical protein